MSGRQSPMRALRLSLYQEWRLKALEGEIAELRSRSPPVDATPWQRTATWRSWDGHDPCPVADDTPVSIMLRSGDVEKVLAGEVSWSQGHGPDAEPDDIVAYRVRSEVAQGGFDA